MDDLKGEHVKTVYAHFGLAIYASQVLEHGLANAILVLDLVPRAASVATPETWPDQVDSFYEGQFRKTLGQLIGGMTKLTSVPSELEGHLARALDRRNWLSHHYFRERAQDFLSERGRDKMIAELEEAQELFYEADRALERVLKPIGERYGYTEAVFQREEQRMRKEAGDDI